MLIARWEDNKNIKKLLSNFPKNIQYKIIKRAVTRAVQSARVAVTKEIKTDYNIDTTHIKQSLNVKQTRNSAFLQVKSRPRALSYFGARPKQPTYKQGQKASVQIKTITERKQVNSAFVAIMNSGHIGVFIHLGNRKIKELYGPSVTGMAKNPLVEQAFIKKVNETLEDRLLHEIDAYMKGYTK